MAARPERNAFLNERVTSVSQLLAQLERDPEVRDRFMRHYGMSRAEIQTYFKTFRIAKLKKPGVFRVFGVLASGKIHAILQRMKVRAVVFVDQAGTPVMRMYCGNPMSLGPNDHTAPNDVDAEVIKSQTVTIEDLEGPEQMAAADLQAETTALEPTIDMVLEEARPPGETPPTTTRTGGQGPATIVGDIGGFNPLGFLPAIGFLVPTNHGKPPPVVPEPASLAALALGAGVLLARRKRAS